MRLENKVAIVTGGSGGIGFAICEAYAREGAKVVLCGSREETTNKALEELKNKYPNADVMGLSINLANADDVKEKIDSVFSKYGHIDILVNNAGVCPTKSILDMTDADFTSTMDININGAFRCTKEVCKYMKDTGGSIINTSSMVGIYGGNHQTAYACSKFAVNGLTKSVAKELGRYHIRCNAVAPGVIETDMVKENVTDDMKMKLQMMTPLGRTGVPTDLSSLYVYLASDESSFTTGTIISVDGGLMI